MILDKSCQLQQNAGDRDRQTVAPNIYCDSQGGKQKKIRWKRGATAPKDPRTRCRSCRGRWRMEKRYSPRSRLMGPGECHKLPQRGPGRAPAANAFWHFLSGTERRWWIENPTLLTAVIRPWPIPWSTDPFKFASINQLINYPDSKMLHPPCPSKSCMSQTILSRPPTQKNRPEWIACSTSSTASRARTTSTTRFH